MEAMDPPAPTPTRQMPMFPLQSVLLPTGVLPLQIFEPRYRAMIRRCIDGDRCFGVALIARGREVGGGDERTDVATVAQIVGANELPDGRWHVVAVGMQRIEVVRWLDDDPYPRAEVRDWPDDVTAEPVASDTWARLMAAGRRVLALAAEAGEQAGEATTEFAHDPALGSFQLAALLPLGPFDRQRLLSAPSTAQRCALLEELCRDRGADLEALLTLRGRGVDDPPI